MIEATTSSVLAGLSDSKTGETASNDADNLGMSTFLQLMTTQLRNQDPSAPQDSSQFLEQMAQFSSLSGIQSMEQSIASAVAGMKSGRLLQASTMVGKQVLINSDSLSAQQPPGAVSGQIDLPTTTTNLSVKVFAESGQIVRTLPLGARSAGQHEFVWDGLDENGNALPAGDYQLIADIAESSELQPLVSLRDRVASVTADAAGDIYLDLVQMKSASLAEVVEVS